MKNKLNRKSNKIIFLEKILRFFSVLIIRKYKPRIIAITGSVGKTSSKEAIFSILSSKFRVRKNEKNYNNEIGVPLTIIGFKTGGRSILKWLGVFLKTLGIIIFPIKYPEILVLEMGADRPGDIKYLTGFIKCDAAVITDISESHLEYFKTIDKVAKEKWTLVENLKENGFAVLNIDNKRILKMKSQSKREDLEFLTFGFLEDSDIKVTEVFYNYSSDRDREEIRGFSFKLNYQGTTIPMRLDNILAQHSVYAALSGIAIGLKFEMNLVEIAAALENFSMPSGRMTLISGIKETFIIDDTYNSSPVSASLAIETLKDIRATRKIAVLGDMLELGTNEESGHIKVIKKVFEIENAILFTVGKRMMKALKELGKDMKDSERIFSFENPMEAGRKLQEIMRIGDLILVKGSQGLRMEKVVEEIMLEPEKAEKLLCRQNKEWKKIPWRKV